MMADESEDREGPDDIMQNQSEGHTDNIDEITENKEDEGSIDGIKSEEGEDGSDGIEGEAIENEEEEENSDEVKEEETKKVTRKSFTIESLDLMLKELGRINLAWPEAKLLDYSNRQHFPLSYTTLTKKEKALLWHAENFRKQYLFAYPDRKPLLLAPENECGVQKFVSTTLRPKRLRYIDMYEWHFCARFIADHLDYEELDPPTKLPTRLCSPATVLQDRIGNSFEISTVLCSLLLGAGFDAYVVSGYATREVCKRDVGGDVCPLLIKKEQVAEVAKEMPKMKYQIKPPKLLISHFEEEMAAREKRKEEQKEKEAEEEEKARIREYEKPPPDPLFGTRIHSWVFVQSGNREIAQPFFIEPLTGDRRGIEDPRYLGLESMWNHENYWVNLQKCYEGCKKLDFDLKDTLGWDHLLLCEEGDPPLNRNTEEDEEEAPHERQRHLDMPFSWVKNLDMDEKNFENRYPGGKKTTLYKKAKLERFAPFLLPDGLLTRLTTYLDYERTKAILMTEWFQDRSDRLVTREISVQENWEVEHFSKGREDHLKEHWHRPNNYSLEAERRLVFYSTPREDGLLEVTTQAREIKCTFQDREDRLASRAARFGVRGILSTSVAPDSTKRPVQWILENYGRNPEKKGSEDVCEREILITEGKYNLKYHYEDGKITFATRQYVRPPVPQYGEQFRFNTDLTSGYQVDPRVANPTNLELFYQLQAEIAAENKAIKSVRDLEDEIVSIMRNRTSEGLHPSLDVSIFDALRNEEASRLRLIWVEEQERLKAIKTETEADVLAPYLARIGYPQKLTRPQALKVREQCLADYKQLLIERVNHIHEVAEKVNNGLQEKHKWYEEEQDELTRDQEEEYMAYVANASFMLQTYDVRIARQKELSMKQYMQLEQRLQADPRLAILTFSVV